MFLFMKYVYITF